MARRPTGRMTPGRKARALRETPSSGPRRRRRQTPAEPAPVPAPVEGELGDEIAAELGEEVEAAEEPGVRGARVRGKTGLNLGTKFALHVAALMTGVMILWGWVISSVTRSKLEEQIVTKGVETARAIALYGRTPIEAHRGGSMGERELASMVKRDLVNMTGERTDLLDVVLSGVHSEKSFTMRGTRFRIRRRGQFPGESDAEIWRITADAKRAIDIRVPITDAQNAKIGQARVLIDARRVDVVLGGLRAKMFGAGLLFLVAGAGLSFVLGAHVAKPAKTLMKGMERVAEGDYDYETPVTSGDEIGRMATQFNYMTWALRELRAKGELVDRIESDLDAAREIQASLLPSKIPQIPGFEMFPFYRSAKEVGGDYYDFFPIDRQRLAMVIADVSGKGIPGSMVMATTRTILRILGPQCGTASETLRQTNMLVARDIRRGMFVTAILAIVNVRTREMAVCSAGHNPMVLYRERTGNCELVNPSGIALGFDKGPVFDRTLQELNVKLEPGDRVVIYTDGVVEAMNENNDEYGDERFYAFVRDHARMRSKDFVHALIRDLDEHKGEAEQHDDITIATLRALS